METILFFGAPWCPHCEKQLEVLKKVDMPKILINVDHAPDVAKEFGIKDLPTTMLVDIDVKKKKLGAMTPEKLDKFLGRSSDDSRDS